MYLRLIKIFGSITDNFDAIVYITQKWDWSKTVAHCTGYIGRFEKHFTGYIGPNSTVVTAKQ